MRPLGTLIMAGLLILCITVLFRVPVLIHPPDPVHNDSKDFTRAADFIAGSLAAPEAPFRLRYPIYPLLSVLVGPLLASFIPSILTPVLVFIVVALAFDSVRSACWAGLVCATSPHLILYAGARLYDSLFLFMTALVLLSVVLFINTPSCRFAALAGACCGIAWATRGQGIAYLVVIPTVAWLTSRVRLWRLTGTAVLACLLVWGGIQASILLLVKRRGATIENVACMKQLIEDGILYSKGREYRDSITYRPDYPNPCELTWGEFVRKHMHTYPRAVAANASRMLYREIAQALSPFVVLALPLSVGVLGMLGSRRVLLTALGVMALGLLAAAVFIQLQDRYLFPLVILASVVAGPGFDHLWGRSRTTCAILLGLVVLAGVHMSYLATTG